MKFPRYLTRYCAITHRQGRALSTWLGASCVLLALTLLPAIARAAVCTSTLGGSAPLVVLVPGFSINANPNVPVGTVLGTATLTWTATNPSAYFTCGVLMPNSSYNGTGSYLGTVGGTTNVYSTSLPGIGVQLSFSNGSQQFPLIRSGNPMSPYHYAPNPSWALTVKLVKTGPIPAGGAITGEIGQGWLADASNGNNFQYASIQLSSSIIFTPTTPTCTVTSPSNIPVSVGSASANSFTGVGSTSSTVTPFSINLSCSGGSSGLTTNMYITLTDQTNPGNTSNVLSLNPASLASGVGIQLRKADNSIISYGPDSNVPGNINQWFVQNTGNGTVTIPLTARLIQTDAHVNPGTVVAYATYTLSYQ